MIGTIADFTIIFEHFSKKWATKYKIKGPRKVPTEFLENSIKIGQAALIWHLSSSRLINFTWQNLVSKPWYFDEDMKIYPRRGSGKKCGSFVERDLMSILHLKADEFKVMHHKYVDQHAHEFYRCIFVPIEHQLIIDDPEDRPFFNGKGAPKHGQ